MGDGSGWPDDPPGVASPGCEEDGVDSPGDWLDGVGGDGSPGAPGSPGLVGG